MLKCIQVTNPKPSGPLIAVQELDGTTVYVDETSFARAGLVGSDILDISWRDFTPPEQHATEERLIATVLKSGLPAYPRVMRQWPTRTVQLVSKTSVISSRRGTRLLLREAHVIDPVLGPPIDLLLDARGPYAELETLEYISQSLLTAAGLANRERWMFLRDLLDMARQQAEQQRAAIQKAVFL